MHEIPKCKFSFCKKIITFKILYQIDEDKSKNHNSKLAIKGFSLLTLRFWKEIIKAGSMQGSHQDLWTETQIPQRVYLCLIAPFSVISSLENLNLRQKGKGLWGLTAAETLQPQPRKWETSLLQRHLDTFSCNRSNSSCIEWKGQSMREGPLTVYKYF